MKILISVTLGIVFSGLILFSAFNLYIDLVAEKVEERAKLEKHIDKLKKEIIKMEDQLLAEKRQVEKARKGQKECILEISKKNTAYKKAVSDFYDQYVEPKICTQKHSFKNMVQCINIRNSEKAVFLAKRGM